MSYLHNFSKNCDIDLQFLGIIMSSTYGIAKMATAIDVRALDANNHGKIEQVTYNTICNQSHAQTFVFV